MRGARDGVQVEWDNASVPADGGLPASEAIVSFDLGHEHQESVSLPTPARGFADYTHEVLA